MNEGFSRRLGVIARGGRGSDLGGVARRIAVLLGAVLFAGLLGGCASGGATRTAASEPGDPDGADIPDAVPRVEPLSRSGNPASYQVRGKRYFTKQSGSGHVERGLASWYGKKFHGRKTSSGERYDMYAMTAAHKTLPLPSYVQVTNMENGRTAVVRVNDRGPFHGPRVIDLSYSAAKKLGVIQKGTAMVEVRTLDASRPGGDPGPFLATKGTPKGSIGGAPKVAATGGRGQVAVVPRGEPEPTRAPPPDAATVAVKPAEPGLEAVEERALDTALAAVAATTAAQSVAQPPPPAVARGEPRLTAAADATGPGLYLQVGAFGDPSNAERLRERLVATLSEQVRVQRSAAGESALYKVRIGPLGSEGEAKAISAKLVTLGVEEPRRVWN